MNTNYDPFNTDFVTCGNPNDYASNYHHHGNDARPKNYYDEDPSTTKAKLTIKNLSNARSAIKASAHKADNMFQSNTAREILNELSSKGDSSSKLMVKEQSSKSSALASLASASSASNLYKRFTPRKKKRHNTAPISDNFMDYMAERDAYKYVSLHCFLGRGIFIWDLFGFAWNFILMRFYSERIFGGNIREKFLRHISFNSIGKIQFIEEKNIRFLNRIIVPEMILIWKWCYVQTNQQKIPYLDHPMSFVRH